MKSYRIEASGSRFFTTPAFLTVERRTVWIDRGGSIPVKRKGRQLELLSSGEVLPLSTSSKGRPVR